MYPNHPLSLTLPLKVPPGLIHRPWGIGNLAPTPRAHVPACGGGSGGSGDGGGGGGGGGDGGKTAPQQIAITRDLVETHGG